jgi:hypothetical protein
MKDAGLTPRRYGLRVREHPDGLLVTALNKMSHARTQRLSYAGQLVQTTHFVTNTTVVRENAHLVGRFLDALGGLVAAKDRATGWLWQNIEPGQLLDLLLRDLSVAAEGWRFQKTELMDFIRKQSGAGELTTWTVALVKTKGAERNFESFSPKVGIAERKPEDESWAPGATAPPLIYAASNANIQSPAHQALDLAEMTLDETILSELLAKRVVADGEPLFPMSEEELLRQCCAKKATLASAAEQLTALRKPPKGESVRSRINGEVARHLRLKTHGLLLIYPVIPTEKRWPEDEEPFMGLAFSFPSSHTARAVDYKVNKVWQATFRDEDYTDAD